MKKKKPNREGRHGDRPAEKENAPECALRRFGVPDGRLIATQGKGVREVPANAREGANRKGT